MVQVAAKHIRRVGRDDVDQVLRVVEAKCGAEAANTLRSYICGLEVGATRCPYCGELVNGSDQSQRQHVEQECQRHYARQLEGRLAIYEDSLA